MKTTVQTTIGLLALLFALGQAHAGTESSGGGASVCTREEKSGLKEGQCKDLLDVHMLKSRIQVSDLSVFPRIEAKLKRIADVLPDFAAELREALGKRWYLSNAEIKELGEKNQTEFEIRQVAMQNEKEIFIDSSWFSSSDDLNREGLLWHEMLVGIFLKENKWTNSERMKLAQTDSRPGRLENPVRMNLQVRGYRRNELAMNGVRHTVEFLLKADSLENGKALQDELWSNGIGAYQTAQEQEKFREEMRLYVTKINTFCRRQGVETPLGPPESYRDPFAENYRLFRPLYEEIMRKQFRASEFARISGTASAIAAKFKWQLIAHDLQVSSGLFQDRGYFQYGLPKEDPFHRRDMAGKQLAMVCLCALYKTVYGPEFLGTDR